jgi:hypothetical protein
MAQPRVQYYGDSMPVDLMMIAGADMIIWVSIRLLYDFKKTGRIRTLIVAVATLPVAFLLLAIAFGGS